MSAGSDSQSVGCRLHFSLKGQQWPCLLTDIPSLTGKGHSLRSNNEIEGDDRTRCLRPGVGRIVADLGRTGPAPGFAAERTAVPGVELRAGRASCVFSRRGTPAWEALEEIVGGLEGGSSVSFASGMAGIAAIFDQLLPGQSWLCRTTAIRELRTCRGRPSRGRWTVHRSRWPTPRGWVRSAWPT